MCLLHHPPLTHGKFCPTLKEVCRLKDMNTAMSFYTVFYQFREAKFCNGGSILSSSQFLILPQLPQKIKLASKVVKVD